MWNKNLLTTKYFEEYFVKQLLKAIFTVYILNFQMRACFYISTNTNCTVTTFQKDKKQLQVIFQ